MNKELEAGAEAEGDQEQDREVVERAKQQKHSGREGQLSLDGQLRDCPRKRANSFVQLYIQMSPCLNIKPQAVPWKVPVICMHNTYYYNISIHPSIQATHIHNTQENTLHIDSGLYTNSLTFICMYMMYMETHPNPRKNLSHELLKDEAILFLCYQNLFTQYTVMPQDTRHEGVRDPPACK